MDEMFKQDLRGPDDGGDIQCDLQDKRSFNGVNSSSNSSERKSNQNENASRETLKVLLQNMAVEMQINDEKKAERILAGAEEIFNVTKLSS